MFHRFRREKVDRRILYRKFFINASNRRWFFFFTAKFCQTTSKMSIPSSIHSIDWNSGCNLEASDHSSDCLTIATIFHLRDESFKYLTETYSTECHVILREKKKKERKKKPAKISDIEFSLDPDTFNCLWQCPPARPAW